MPRKHNKINLHGNIKSYKSKTYLKIIQMTDISEADYLSLKEIHQLANEVHDHIQDKNVKKTAKKLNRETHAFKIWLEKTVVLYYPLIKFSRVRLLK